MIDFKSTLKMALTSLKVNKLRSALTSLGIIIGVSAVIIMLAIGTGASQKVQANMESMGSNMLTIRSASAKTGGVRMGVGTKPSLTLKDATAIQKMIIGVDAVAPASSEGKQVMYGNQNWQTTVYGTTSPYLYIKNYEIEELLSVNSEMIRSYIIDLKENSIKNRSIITGKSDDSDDYASFYRMIEGVNRMISILKILDQLIDGGIDGHSQLSEMSGFGFTLTSLTNEQMPVGNLLLCVVQFPVLLFIIQCFLEMLDGLAIFFDINPLWEP